MAQGVDLLVLEYLAEVTSAAQHLPPKLRTDYVHRLREQIERRRAEAKATTEAQMRRILREFGDPADLVARQLENASSPGADPDADAGTSPDSGRSARRSVRRPLGLLSRPVTLVRAPPPWRGGPRRTELRRRSEASAGPPPRPPRGYVPAEGTLGRYSPGVVFVRCVHGARRNPLAALAALLYLVCGLIGQITVLWPLAAVQVAFGRPWLAADKWVALGLPVLGTALGMALWPGQAPYIDLFIQESFQATGVMGLRATIVVCAFFLLLRLSRIVAARRSRAGHFPVTGDTPFGQSPRNPPEKNA